MGDVGQKFRDFVAELKATHFGEQTAVAQRPLTEAEMHAKYADANHRLREIYGTTEGTPNAD